MHKKILFFLLLLLSLAAPKAMAKEIAVHNENDLHRALQLAHQGDVITLKKGTYRGNLVINRSVTIRGEDGAIIIGTGEGNVITVAADDVVIDNLDIQQSGSQDAGIYITANRTKMLNNIIHDVFHGIVVRNGYGTEIRHNQITSFAEKKAFKGFGIYLTEAPQTKIIENNIFRLQDGIYISYSNFCEVQKNKIWNARYGVHTMDSKNIAIAQNEVSESRNGFMIMQSDYVLMTGNVLQWNTTIDGVGIFMFDTFYSEITNNIMRGNKKGMYIENVQKSSIRYNIFEQNDTGLDIGKSSKENTIYLNNFLKNIRQIISAKNNKNTFSWEGLGNYYDDWQTMDLNRDNIVDYAYKSGDASYYLMTKEPLLQIFYESPAIRLWNMIEQYTPIPSDQFIVDRHALATPVTIHTHTNTNEKKNEAAPFPIPQLSFFLLLTLWSGATFLVTRRKYHET